jgi:fucose 4-O-acetylase-like acetyltransferase
MEQPKANRIGYIDALRGMAMILVVYFHIAAYGFGSYELGYNDIIERFRMPTFFFISGWLFYKAGRIWDRQVISGMIRKKFMVQIVPTVVFMLLYLAMFNLLDISSFGSDKKGYWFTFVLFEYFVIYILAESLLNQQNSTKGEVRVFAIILILSVSAFYYAKYYTRYTVELGVWKDILGIFSFVKIRHIIFFLMGTLVRRHFDQFIQLTDNRYFTALLITLFTAIIVWPAVLSFNGVDYIAYLVAGVSGTIICFTFFRIHARNFSQETWYGRGLQLIGRRTLDIYLIHYFVLPYDLVRPEVWIQYHNNTLFVPMALILAIWVVIISLLISSILRVSPLLAKYLFGTK